MIWSRLRGPQGVVAQSCHGLLYDWEVLSEPGGIDQRRTGIFFKQVAPGGRQAQPHLPFVGGIALASDIAHGLQLLEDGRQRVGFEEELFAERPDSLLVCVGQRHHGDVLGVGQAELVQDRLVCTTKGLSEVPQQRGIFHRRPNHRLTEKGRAILGL